MSSVQAADDSYFNDLSRQPSLPDSAPLPVPTEASPGESFEVPKPKRVACAICRKRKLKCDGGRPKCGTCARLGHNCAYDEVRRKSGPKRGYVKELEARLAHVETQLKNKAKGKKPPTPSESSQSQDQYARTPSIDHTLTSSSGDGYQTYCTGPPHPANDFFENMALPKDDSGAPSILPDLNTIASPIDDGMTWEMIGLGLEEPLPTQEAIDELFRAAMGLCPHMRPPVCLRYAMWCLAANLSGKYRSHQEIFYRRARKYAEMDEMKGLGEAFVSIAHAQCWILIATYEFQCMFFPRAWASVGRAVRLVLMMGLNRLDLDGASPAVKQVLPDPRDWTEREERRRTFWMAYCTDRYASMGTGWPLAMDERDVMTNLPANEENFEQSTPEDTTSLSDSMSAEGAAKLSPVAGAVYMSHIFGKNLAHLHRPGTDDKEDDIQGEFWKRHRQLDNMLLKTSLSLPAHLRLPAGIRNPNCVFMNMCIHTSTICLHQAALFKAEKKNLPASMIMQSSTRCLLAATEITNTMRLISHLDCRGMNPFTAFCLYVACRVFIHVLKKSSHEAEVRSSLEFLLTAMQQLKTTNPLAESFLIQLGLDLQGVGVNFLVQNPTHSSIVMAKLAMINQHQSQMGCSPVVDIRDSKKHMHSSQFVTGVPKTRSDYGVPQIIRNGEETGFRSTQYSMQSFDLPSHPSPQPERAALGTLDGPMMDGLRKVSSGDPFGRGLHGSAVGVHGMQKSYDTDKFGGQTSSGATPGEALSKTSYSPASQHSAETGISTNLPKPTAFQAADPTTGAPKFFNFTNGDGNFVAAMPSQPSQRQTINADFDLASPTWNFDNSTASPSNFTTGLTPAADGEWSQMLDPMNWDSTGLETNATQWGTSPGGTI
ncbi:MAG: hypothetical protein LQ348_004587 [Seirophora lacunosa]|nr:MAG: hypothetical protein LQ348_004587 [Seirophora lacunosa]